MHKTLTSDSESSSVNLGLIIIEPHAITVPPCLPVAQLVPAFHHAAILPPIHATLRSLARCRPWAKVRFLQVRCPGVALALTAVPRRSVLNLIPGPLADGHAHCARAGNLGAQWTRSDAPHLKMTVATRSSAQLKVRLDESESLSLPRHCPPSKLAASLAADPSASAHGSVRCNATFQPPPPPNASRGSHSESEQPCIV